MPKNFFILIFIVCYFMYMEIIFNLTVFSNLNFFSFLTIFLFSINISLFYYLIISFTKEIINKIIFISLLIIFTFLYISQMIFFKIYDSIYYFSAAGQAGAVTQFFTFIVQIIYQNIFIFILFLLPIILFFSLQKKFFNLNANPYKIQIIVFLLIVFIHLLTINTLRNDKIYSAHNLYYNIHSPLLMTNEFGLITTLRLDLQRIIFNFEDNITFFEIEDNVIENKEEEVEIIIEYNEFNIDWESAIANEKNDTLLRMHQYFSQLKPTEKNDYTGIFEGKNLVWIIAESFDHIAIDQEITPTLYKIANEGFNFTNFYTPIFLSTIDGEYITKTGLLPKSNAISFYHTPNKYLPLTLSQQFKKLDYQTLAYHNGQHYYYRRHLSHPALGYEYFACGRGLNINCSLWPQSDWEMIKNTTSDYLENGPFLAYYLTISGHLHYNMYNAMAKRNWDQVKHLEYSTPIKCFLAQHVELDKALAQLINDLENAGLAEETVIAISSDHWPYELSIDQLNEKSTFDRNYLERDRLPFIIWHKGIEGHEVEKLGSSVDILATLSNLFGLEYDSRLLIGQDIFSNKDPIVIFQDRSWITNLGTYNNINQVFTPHDTDVPIEYIETINQRVFNKIQMSSLILDHDYYKIIKEYIIENKKTN